MLMAKTEFSNVFSYNSKPSLRFAKITQGIKCVLGPLGTQFLIPSLWPQKWLSALNISGIFSILQWREDNHILNSLCSYHQLSSVQWLSHVHGLQHSRPPCPSPTPRVYSNSCPLSWWCHPTISSSVVPFSSCLQSFPASVIHYSKCFTDIYLLNSHMISKYIPLHMRKLKHYSFL